MKSYSSSDEDDFDLGDGNGRVGGDGTRGGGGGGGSQDWPGEEPSSWSSELSFLSAIFALLSLYQSSIFALMQIQICLNDLVLQGLGGRTLFGGSVQVEHC